MFSEEQIERYSRHIILKEVGGKGQKRLLDGKVLIIGAGALGSPAALYLAAAGVGVIGIADSDVVELSNLQRQIIHHSTDLGIAKVESARQKMESINPDVKVVTHQDWIGAENILEIIRNYDFVIDGTDNFASKFLINDACVMSDTPYSHAGILHFIGQALTVLPHQSPCFRCAFPKPPPANAIPTCSQAGVIGVLPGVIGSIQATEAIKYLLDVGDLLTDRLLIYDAEGMDFQFLPVVRNQSCPVCGDNPSITDLKDEPEAMNTCDLE
ncbi:adenylyltransferase [Syntrophotalea acetylenivorans]|uniref:Molybdopterin-synthase adenylyltransferase n=1 Tax=Syntrophotalea acetylenivorans TaxID=1842532 RepID=A0A1L3GML7_9BACT|nr:ThiF family adenylyltransferase [Syntrophotalea acetylenivorans]APG27174.1 adenylyltransferase [Syntrophotalea acetylenivorans]